MQAAEERQRSLRAAEGPRPAQAVAECLSVLSSLEAMGRWPGPRDPVREQGVYVVRERWARIQRRARAQALQQREARALEARSCEPRRASRRTSSGWRSPLCTMCGRDSELRSRDRPRRPAHRSSADDARPHRVAGRSIRPRSAHVHRRLARRLRHHRLDLETRVAILLGDAHDLGGARDHDDVSRFRLATQLARQAPGRHEDRELDPGR